MNNMRKLFECPTDGYDGAETESLGGLVGDVASQVASALMNLSGEDEDSNELLTKRFSQYLGMLRAMHLWYHGAHHAVRGVSFSGDHVNLFGKLYLESQEEIDGAIEKAVGLTENEGVSCPVHITKLALQVLMKYPSPPNLTSVSMAATGLQLESDYLELVTQMFEDLDEAGALSLGLNDFLAATANAHEDRIYLLRQRVKSDINE